jgi:hypothetical protein
MRRPGRPSRSSVILLREWEQQMSSSGCCGRLEGDALLWHGERCFPERRRLMEGAGALYRAVRDAFGNSVEVRVVDPRNVPGMLPMLIQEFRRHRVPLREMLRTLAGVSVNTVVVNGRLFSRGAWPTAERLCEALDGGQEAGPDAEALPGRVSGEGAG